MDEGNPSFFNRYSYGFNDPVNMIDPDGQRPRPRGTTPRSISGELRYQSYANSAYQVGVWTGVPQAHSLRFTPSQSQVSSMSARLNMVRRQSLNQVYQSGQQTNRNGLTSFGRAFQKHSSRGQDSTFARNGESTARDFNARGAELFRSIVNSRGTTTTKARNGDIHVRTKSGSGVSVRRNSDGKLEFKGFLSASKRAPRRQPPPTGTRIRRNR